jgi:glyoxylase-like metal-dependent hydrolase (beta-lactamase superfamily II)
MFPAADRRDFLRISLGAAAGLSWGRSLRAAERQFAQDSRLTAARLSETLVHIQGAGGNVLALQAPGGVVMVNGGSPDRADALRSFIDQQFPRTPVRTLFNTDWHPEHTGANEILGAAGTEIIAHEHTKQYLGSDVVVEWQTRTYKARPAQALPTKTFQTRGELVFAGERIEYGHLGQAHTDADIYVHFPGPNVLVAGDVVSVGTYPIADYTTGGWLGGLATATKTLLDLADDRTRVVPGIGPLLTRADLQAQHEMLVAVRERLGKMMRQGMGASDMIAAGATKDFDPKWGDPTLFVSTTYRGLWLHVRELGGVV